MCSTALPVNPRALTFFTFLQGLVIRTYDRNLRPKGGSGGSKKKMVGNEIEWKKCDHEARCRNTHTPTHTYIYIYIYIYIFFLIVCYASSLWPVLWWLSLEVNGPGNYEVPRSCQSLAVFEIENLTRPPKLEFLLDDRSFSDTRSRHYHCEKQRFREYFTYREFI